MIVFDLQCSSGHKFEGWFDDSDAYEDQHQRSLIACPICSDTHISKAPTAFAIKSSQPAPSAPNTEAQLMALAEKISDIVEKNFENVGCGFAKEALKIHYGVSEPRNIRGVTTQEEEKTLKEEGIQYFKVPVSSTDSDDA